MPVRHGAGNHEMVLEHDNPRDEFERRFGPTYYSFDWGPLHCIVLDGNKPIPGQSGWQAVHGAVEGSELEWLKADLAAQLPDFVTLSNPFDYNTSVWGDGPALESCFSTMMAGAFDAVMLLLDYPRPDTPGHEGWHAAFEAFLAAPGRHPLRLVRRQLHRHPAAGNELLRHSGDQCDQHFGSILSGVQRLRRLVSELRR